MLERNCSNDRLADANRLRLVRNARVSLVSRHVPDRRGRGMKGCLLCRNGLSSGDCGSWAARVLRGTEIGGEGGLGRAVGSGEAWLSSQG